MKQEEHLKRTNGKGEKVHQFMDQYSRSIGPDHRVVLHHRLGIEMVARLFGPEFIWIAEKHIKDDWMGLIPNDFFDEDFYTERTAIDVKRFNKALDEAKRLFGSK